MAEPNQALHVVHSTKTFWHFLHYWIHSSCPPHYLLPVQLFTWPTDILLNIFFFPNLPPYNLPWLKHLHPSYISLFGHQHTKEYILCWVATYNSIYVLLMLYCWVATINYIYFILYVFVPFICFVNRSSSILKVLF